MALMEVQTFGPRVRGQLGTWTPEYWGRKGVDSYIRARGDGAGFLGFSRGRY